MNQKSDSANLDILRAVAVTMVVMDHVCESVSRRLGEFIHPWDWAWGRFGVLLFFVHTSLVLHYSMQRMNLEGWELARAFLIRRAFRIYPLAILCVLTVVLLHVPTMPWETFEWFGAPNLLSNLALTMNLTFSRPVLGPLWSLPLEVQMYVALPLVFLAVRRPRGFIIAIGLWCLAVLVAIIQPSVSDRANVLSFTPCFLGGVIAFTLSSRTPRWIAGMWWIPFLGALIGVYLMIQVSIGDIFFYPTQWVACFVLGMALPQFKESSCNTMNQIAAWIAKYSYGIYLFHCICLWVPVALRLDMSIGVELLVSGILLVAVSMMTYHCIEVPAMRLGSKLSRGVSSTKRKVLGFDS